MYKTVIWDWNGTLLNDVKLCIESINILLKNRNLPLLSTERYKDIFDFPVIKYYEVLGFDFSKESFEIPATQFTDLYHSKQDTVELFPDTIETLLFIKDSGSRQYILSAMEDGNLKKMINHAGIDKYFDGIFGIKDDFAREKATIGKQMIKDLNLNVLDCVMIGDTLHDAEVAEYCGFNCILYSGGHVSKERLQSKNLQIIDKISDLKTLLKSI